MPVLTSPPPTTPLRLDGDRRLARRELRVQIARLERRLAAAGEPLPAPGPPGAPRLLGLEGLERVRDDLVGRVAAAQSAAAARGAAQARARARREAMLADPRAHKWECVTRAELGEPGCGDWHVRPRLGLLGLLAGWWEVKLSSGCPLAMAHPPQHLRRVHRRNAVVEAVVVTIFLTVIIAMAVWFFFFAGSPMAPYN